MNALIGSLLLSTLTWSVGGDITLSWTDTSGAKSWNVYRSHNGEPMRQIRAGNTSGTVTIKGNVVPMETECFQIAPVIKGVEQPRDDLHCILLMDAPQ